MADSSKPEGHSGDSSTQPEVPVTPAEADDLLTPDGAELGNEELADPPAPVEVAADETEAEELLDPVDDLDTPDEADPEDVVIDDPEQLDEATAVAQKAKSSRPVKRNQTVAPVKKSKPTPKRDDAHQVVVKRTTPALFVRQAIGELKKVVWPTGAMLRQYFVVVLVFVLFVMFFVAGLDALFGWLLLKWLG